MDIYVDVLAILLIVFILFLLYITKKVHKSQIKTIFIINIIILFWICLFLVLQYFLPKFWSIPLIYFENFIYIGTVFLPIAIFFTALIFINTKIKFRKSYILLFIIPVLSLILLWTNDAHHLFYETYSLDLTQTVTGPYAIIHQVYTYLILFISIFLLLKYSIKNAGFFSKQSLLFCIGSLIPVIVNILGSFNIIPMSIYITPISFAITIFFYGFAIFKFNFLKVNPIAMQRIVDRMSDSFLVVSIDGTITDFNDTFLKTFNLNADNVRNANFLQFVTVQNINGINANLLKPILEKCKKTEKIILVKREIKINSNYFNIEASGIFSKNNFLGTLILIKNVTQHVLDRNTIENNQNILMERERLASLGQLIGGIAHNLKTPIMSISGAAEGLDDLIKEYEVSVGDPDVTNEDHHAIASDMKEWIEKVRSYTEYMSDVITAVKGQAVTMAAEQAVSFTLDELVKRVNILMKHELKNALITLNVHMMTDPNISLNGNINSLVQVINNMISNAIQAYDGKENEGIELILNLENNKVIISIKDYAGGLPQEVSQKLFREMITTKGKNGTGLGLFMSYSTIRAHFSGNITYETEKGQGTVFHISLPITPV